MKTFRDFTSYKCSEDKINLAASLMTDLKLDPMNWVLEWSARCPALEVAMLREFNEYESARMELLCEDQPQLAQQTMPGAQPQQGMQKAGAPSFGQMAGQVGQAVGNFFAGPARRFNLAQQALMWLKKKIDSLPNAKDLKTTKNEPLSNWLDSVIKELTSQAQQIPALIQRYEQGGQQQAGQQQGQPQVQPQQPQPATGTA